MKRLPVLAYLLFVHIFTFAQDIQIERYNVSEMYLEGKAWRDSTNAYHRFPDKAKKMVRPEVWGLSTNSAGLSVNFHTNSPTITVRYKVSGGFSYSHMPSTGKSGVDLYAIDKNGKEHWLRGNYTFKDTISYTFKGIISKEKRLYQLYLPLYNTVKWMEIAVNKGSIFQSDIKRKEKPIVVYGTSIAQGACATRPGMAWTNILKRKLDWPVINFGFSGNGRLEKEVISLINEIDASVYVLDCMPNFYFSKGDTPELVEERILKSVKQIRKKHLNTPILITQHAGYSDGSLQTERKDIYEKLNMIAEKAFKKLKEQGVNNLYLFTKDELGLTIDSFVDGTHPNDLGMMQYAIAYEKKLRFILK